MNKQILGLMVILSASIFSGCSQGGNDAGPVNLTPAANGTTGIRALPLSVTLKQGNNALLEWTQGIAQIAYYDLEVLGSNGYSNLVRIPVGKLSFLDTGLTANVDYSYALRAYDQNNALLQVYSATARINAYSATSSDKVL